MSWTTLFAVSSVAYVLYYLNSRRNRLPLPPGPKGIPLLGNVLSIPAKFEWFKYHEWSRELGTDILYLNMFGQSVIVLDKAEVTKELLDKRSTIYSSRASFPFLHEVVGIHFNIGLNKYDETWREFRRLVHPYFGQQNTDHRVPCIRAVDRLMRRLISGPVDIKAELHWLTGDAVLAACYGVDIQSEHGPYCYHAVTKGVDIYGRAMVPGRFLVDFLPVLKYVPEWFPGAGFRREAKKFRDPINLMLNLPLQMTQQHMAASGCPPCFACTALNVMGVSFENMDDDQLVLLRKSAGTMYAAGTDTTSTALTSCVLGLLAQPGILIRAREELDRVVAQGCLPTFEDQPSLPFITAIAKEALRWRDVIPLGVPHYVEVEDEYAGYRIPAGSLVIANQWALLHDEELYPDPFVFKPERFMKGDEFNVDTKDPEYACYGFGRRICPGKYLANSLLWITIASLIYVFDIEKEVDDQGQPIEPDPLYSSDLFYAPGAFPCRIKPRSKGHADLVMSVVQ